MNVQHGEQEASVHLIVQINEILELLCKNDNISTCSSLLIIKNTLFKGVFTRNIISQNLFSRKMQMCSISFKKKSL